MTRIFSILIAVLFLSVGHTASAQDKLLLQLAEGGSALFQVNLGLAYENGTSGVEQDYAESLKWYRLAAEQGSVFAQIRLGGIYYNGSIIEQDYAESLKWYRLAAEQGDARAQYILGRRYHTGDGVEKNEVEAVEWYRSAAEQGYAYAQWYLGDAYYNGEGVEQDYDEARTWRDKSYKQGLQATYTLGTSYSEPELVMPEDLSVLVSMRKAVEQIIFLAQVNFGSVRHNGEGVE